MRIAAALVLPVLLAATPAAAKGRPTYSKAYDACMAKANTTVDMDDCNKGEMNRRTPLLTKAFDGALGRISADVQPKLRAAERAWIAARDADCGIYEDRDEFGSFGVIQAGQCMIDRTISRTRDLDDFALSLAGPNS